VTGFHRFPCGQQQSAALSLSVVCVGRHEASEQVRAKEQQTDAIG